MLYSFYKILYPIGGYKLTYIGVYSIAMIIILLINLPIASPNKLLNPKLEMLLICPATASMAVFLAASVAKTT